MRYLGTLSTHWPRKSADYMVERQLYWSVRRAIGAVFAADFGKRVYDNAGVIQVETGTQRDARLGK